MNTVFLLFITFFRIGFFTFGGGYAMIPMMQEAVTETYKWIDTTTFLDVIAIAESTPGIIAVNMATFIGTTVTGHSLGGIITTIGVVLPSSIIVYILAKFFTKFKENQTFESILKFIRLGIPGIIATAGVTLLDGAIADISSIIIIALTIYISICKKIHPILLLAIAGLAGVVIY